MNAETFQTHYVFLGVEVVCLIILCFWRIIVSQRTIKNLKNKLDGAIFKIKEVESERDVMAKSIELLPIDLLPLETLEVMCTEMHKEISKLCDRSISGKKELLELDARNKLRKRITRELHIKRSALKKDALK